MRNPEDAKANWNRRINDRRVMSKGHKSGFKKGDFSPRSPEYRLPLDVYNDPSIQGVENFFVEQRDREGLTPDQLMGLNAVQNEMRAKLVNFPSVVHAETYRGRKETRPYVERAERIDGEGSLSEKVLRVVADEYRERAEKVLAG